MLRVGVRVGVLGSNGSGQCEALQLDVLWCGLEGRLLTHPNVCLLVVHPTRQADLLVCDANDHVKCLPTFLGPVLPLLRPGGDVVLTLKYYGRGPKTGDVAGKMAELLPVRC